MPTIPFQLIMIVSISWLKSFPFDNRIIDAGCLVVIFQITQVGCFQNGREDNRNTKVWGSFCRMRLPTRGQAFLRKLVAEFLL